VKFLEVPTLRHPEIKKIVQAEAVKYIPYPKEEMIVRYRDLPRGDEEERGIGNSYRCYTIT
jgi:Tfp pilus assembly PilM family ATPase